MRIRVHGNGNGIPTMIDFGSILDRSRDALLAAVGQAASGANDPVVPPQDESLLSGLLPRSFGHDAGLDMDLDFAFNDAPARMADWRNVMLWMVALVVCVVIGEYHRPYRAHEVIARTRGLWMGWPAHERSGILAVAISRCWRDRTTYRTAAMARRWHESLSSTFQFWSFCPEARALRRVAVPAAAVLARSSRPRDICARRMSRMPPMTPTDSQRQAPTPTKRPSVPTSPSCHSGATWSIFAQTTPPQNCHRPLMPTMRPVNQTPALHPSHRPPLSPFHHITHPMVQTLR